MILRRLTLALACAVAVTGTAAPAQQETAPSQATTAPDGALFPVAPIGEHGLAQASGREAAPLWQSASAASTATVKDNAVGDNSPTGALGVSDQAFQNVSGISMVNLNTGNGSVINAAMNINLSITMAPVSGTPGGM